jgi:hypothetical protein
MGGATGRPVPTVEGQGFMNDLMMSPGQIAAGCLLTAVGVAVAAAVVRWPRGQVLVAAIGSVALVAAWRGLCNILGSNGEFAPPVTVADLSCLVAGAIGPILATLLPGTPAGRKWVPALTGGFIAFATNVAGI